MQNILGNGLVTVTFFLSFIFSLSACSNNKEVNSRQNTGSAITENAEANSGLSADELPEFSEFQEGHLQYPIGYVSESSHTFFLFFHGSQGLDRFEGFEPVQDVEAFSVSNYLVAYKTRLGDVLHIVKIDGQNPPLLIHLIPGVGKFSISNELVAYKRIGSQDLNIIRVHNQSIYEFPPIFRVGKFVISDQLIAVKQEARDFRVLRVNGQELSELISEPGVREFDVSNHLIAYKDRVENGTYEFRILDAQGQPIPNYTPIRQVDKFAVSNRFVAYRQSLRHELHVCDEQGRSFPGFTSARDVGKFSISDHFLAYYQIIPGDLENSHIPHIYDSEGRYFPNLARSPVDLLFVNNSQIAYVPQDATNELHIISPGIQSADHVIILDSYRHHPIPFARY